MNETKKSRENGVKNKVIILRLKRPFTQWNEKEKKSESDSAKRKEKENKYLGTIRLDVCSEYSLDLNVWFRFRNTLFLYLSLYLSLNNDKDTTTDTISTCADQISRVAYH